MKMRFWQKTYIFTLILFLVCLNGGILSLTVYTHNKNVDAAEATASAEQYYIAISFERDYTDLTITPLADPALLMQAYCSYYSEKGISLAFLAEGEALYSSIEGEYSLSNNTISHKEIDGKRHIFISCSVCDGEYDLIFAKNVESLDTEFRALMIIYVCTAFGVSSVLALGLYFILKKLSSPLDSLRKTTELIEGGDFSVSAEEKGNDEFTLLAKSFNSMLSTINTQMKALETDAEKKQMLVDNLAHELRTPLTSIHGYAEYLEKAATTEENKIVAAKYIMSESERLKKISDILLDSAFIRENTAEMEDIDLAYILSDTCQRLFYKAEQRGVKLVFEGESTTVQGNSTLLSMLFYNLAENGIKACLQGGEVVLSCYGNKAYVTDNGKGMTPEQLVHITEPFYRTDKSRSRAEGGAGLGLALCKQIAQSHGAQLNVTSAKGEGTKIEVVFTS